MRKQWAKIIFALTKKYRPYKKKKAEYPSTFDFFNYNINVLKKLKHCIL